MWLARLGGSDISRSRVKLFTYFIPSTQLKKRLWRDRESDDSCDKQALQINVLPHSRLNMRLCSSGKRDHSWCQQALQMLHLKKSSLSRHRQCRILGWVDGIKWVKGITRLLERSLSPSRERTFSACQEVENALGGRSIPLYIVSLNSTKLHFGLRRWQKMSSLGRRHYETSLCRTHPRGISPIQNAENEYLEPETSPSRPRRSTNFSR